MVGADDILWLLVMVLITVLGALGQALQNRKARDSTGLGQRRGWQRRKAEYARQLEAQAEELLRLQEEEEEERTEGEVRPAPPPAPRRDAEAEIASPKLAQEGHRRGKVDLLEWMDRGRTHPMSPNQKAFVLIEILGPPKSFRIRREGPRHLANFP